MACVLLVDMADGLFDVEARVDLLAGIEDIVGVEDGLGLLEEIKDWLAKHLGEVWGADDTVIVLAADVTFVLDGGLVEPFSHFLNKEWRGLLGEIEEGIEVEVSIATVSVNGRLHIKLLKE